MPRLFYDFNLRTSGGCKLILSPLSLGQGGGGNFGKGFLFWTELPHFFHKHVNNFFRDPFIFVRYFQRMTTVFLKVVTDRRRIKKAQVDAKPIWNCLAVLFINCFYVAKKDLFWYVPGR